MKNFKSLIILNILFLLILGGCNSDNQNDDLAKVQVWKGNEYLIQSKDVLKKEIEEKIGRVKEFLTHYKLEGVLLTQVRNFYWITAGIANNQIVLNKDVGAASILIKKDGSRYLLCSGSEAGRLMDETLGELGYELKMFNWYETNPVKDVRAGIIHELAGKGKIGSDTDYPGTINVSDAFKKLRYILTDSEIERYRWLGKETTEAVANVCRSIMPGMNEYELEARTAAEIRSRGIIPTVLLTAVDERIYNYRHALPGGAELKKYAMINVVAEKWGMPIAVTRFVHFGELDKELKSKLEKVAVVNAHFQEATKPGVNAGTIFEKCKEWYASVGYEGEWMKHHQGGAIGYDDREWVIYPGINETVHENQAFAWNPTITGAKVEETIVTTADGFEVVTTSKDWPMINVELNGKIYPQPAILIRNEKTGEVIESEVISVKAN
jgi:antitoxin VapB